MTSAQFLRVRGIVQGVGFRPFVFRLAQAHGLVGWVLNGEEGVEIHVEGPTPALDRFVGELTSAPPPAARIAEVETAPAAPQGFAVFAIRESERRAAPTVRITPDLSVCASCLDELSSPTDRRQGYPYINCTDCGPRFSIVLSLPYDRPRTTMRAWPMCPDCAAEYEDPLDRRFHAQPIACPVCGPRFFLQQGAGSTATRPPSPKQRVSSAPERSWRSRGSGAITWVATRATRPPSPRSASASSAKRNRSR
jgi:hydrogenase maturation protein HypF